MCTSVSLHVLFCPIFIVSLLHFLVSFVFERSPPSTLNDTREGRQPIDHKLGASGFNNIGGCMSWSSYTD